MRRRAFAAARTLLALVALLAAPGLAAAQGELTEQQRKSAAEWLDNVHAEAGIETTLPGDLRAGSRAIAAGAVHSGDLVTFRGAAEIAGTVQGDVIALGGDVVVLDGARIEGSAVSVGGRVRLEGGAVDGEIVETALRSIERGTFGARTSPVLIALGWAGVMLLIGLVALLLARRNLERVAEAVRERFARSLLWGVVAQLGFFPAILIIIVALAITVIGILVIPIALVVFLTAFAGAMALGFIAVAYATGDRMPVKGGGTPMPLALAAGLALYIGSWVLAALLAEVAVVGVLLRAIVGLLTWIAMTAGLGATILTRGGTRDLAPAGEPVPDLPDDSWQTPTPVGGVVAARRPTPAPTPRVDR